MAGRPDFSTAGSRGSGQTIAVTNRPELQYIDSGSTASIAAGASEITEIYAPTGSVYQCFGMFLRCDGVSAAASGQHDFVVLTLGNIRLTYGSSLYSDRVRYQDSTWVDATNRASPDTDNAQSTVPSRLMATENNPISTKYHNQTDVSHSNKRYIEFTFKEDSY